MSFYKYAKIKAITFFVACVVLLAIACFSLYRSFFDAQKLVHPSEEEPGEIMMVGMGAIVLFFYWFLGLTLFIGAIPLLVASILLFKKDGPFLKKRSELSLGKNGKIFAAVSLLILFLVSPTIISKIFYGAFFAVFVASAILDIVFLKRYPKS